MDDWKNAELLFKSLRWQKIVITQPTFLPYAGYFAALLISDEVVFLDHIQFSKRSWQQRNLIKLKKRKNLLQFQ